MPHALHDHTVLIHIHLIRSSGFFCRKHDRPSRIQQRHACLIVRGKKFQQILCLFDRLVPLQLHPQFFRYLLKILLQFILIRHWKKFYNAKIRKKTD